MSNQRNARCKVKDLMIKVTETAVQKAVKKAD